jgi:hypothetical protein
MVCDLGGSETLSKKEARSDKSQTCRASARQSHLTDESSILLPQIMDINDMGEWPTTHAPIERVDYNRRAISVRE